MSDMMIYCPYCGRQTDPNMAFCPYCGKKKVQPVPPAAPIQAAPSPTPIPQPQVQQPQPAMPPQPVQPQVQQPWVPQPQMQPQQVWAPQTMPQPEKKKKLGLIIGIAAGVLAAIAAVILCIVLMGNNNPERIAEKAASAAFRDDQKELDQYCLITLKYILTRSYGSEETALRSLGVTSYEEFYERERQQREEALRGPWDEDFRIDTVVLMKTPEMTIRDYPLSEYSTIMDDDTLPSRCETAGLTGNEKFRLYLVNVTCSRQNDSESIVWYVALAKIQGKWMVLDVNDYYGY